MCSLVDSAALVERLLASFPDNVDESMQHKVLDVADEKDVSSLHFVPVLSIFFVFMFYCLSVGFFGGTPLSQRPC